MTDSEQFTLYDNETQQSMTVTVNDLDESSSGIQYLNQDGTPVSVSQLAHTDISSEPTGPMISSLPNINPASFTTAASTGSATGSATGMPVMVSSGGQSLLQSNTLQQAATNLLQGTTPAGTTAITTPGGVPQMLFLNQVNVNGQTSFVLVDANNKPIQLPQGIQVVNLQPQNMGQQLPMPGESGEEPLYVNAKQYHRILKRRQARAKLESLGKIPKERQKYLYESRHRHAIKRQRGQGGVFTTGEEVNTSLNDSRLNIGSLSDLHPNIEIIGHADDLDGGRSLGGHPGDILSHLTT